MSIQTRVVAISHALGEVQWHPRRDTQLVAGDTAYLVGPHRELPDTLHEGQRVQLQRDVSPGSTRG